jgi:hypothetical protein
VLRHAEALMAFRRNELDEDGEPSARATAGALLEAEVQRIALGIGRV